MGLQRSMVGDENIGAQFPETPREKNGFGVTDQLGAHALSSELLADPNPFEEGNGPGQTSVGIRPNFYLAKACRLARGRFCNEAPSVVTSEELRNCLLVALAVILRPERRSQGRPGRRV